MVKSGESTEQGPEKNSIEKAKPSIILDSSRWKAVLKKLVFFQLAAVRMA